MRSGFLTVGLTITPPLLTYTVTLMPSLIYRHSLNETQHDRTNKMTCAPAEDSSDQPGHLPSLNKSSLCAQWVANDPRFFHADSYEDSDQTWRMPGLICVFAVRTCQCVGFVMQRLKYCIHVTGNGVRSMRDIYMICISRQVVTLYKL